MLRKEKSKKRKDFRKEMDEKPRRRGKHQKIKYRHQRAWLEEEN